MKFTLDKREPLVGCETLQLHLALYKMLARYFESGTRAPWLHWTSDVYWME